MSPAHHGVGFAFAAERRHIRAMDDEARAVWEAADEDRMRCLDAGCERLEGSATEMTSSPPTCWPRYRYFRPLSTRAAGR